VLNPCEALQRAIVLVPKLPHFAMPTSPDEPIDVNNGRVLTSAGSRGYLDNQADEGRRGGISRRGQPKLPILILAKCVEGASLCDGESVLVAARDRRHEDILRCEQIPVGATRRAREQASTSTALRLTHSQAGRIHCICEGQTSPGGVVPCSMQVAIFINGCNVLRAVERCEAADRLLAW
jgi:hypothetical protein